jgi:hypothetical protein
MSLGDFVEVDAAPYFFADLRIFGSSPRPARVGRPSPLPLLQLGERS